MTVSEISHHIMSYLNHPDHELKICIYIYIYIYIHVYVYIINLYIYIVYIIIIYKTQVGIVYSYSIPGLISLDGPFYA